MACLVEYSGNSPGTEVLARDLFDIVWSFRQADIPEVRASVLYAVATSFQFLKEETRIRLLLNDSPQDGVLPYLSYAKQHESDESCRQLIGTVLDAVTATFEAIQAETLQAETQHVSNRIRLP